MKEAGVHKLTPLLELLLLQQPIQASPGEGFVGWLTGQAVCRLHCVPPLPADRLFI